VRVSVALRLLLHQRERTAWVWEWKWELLSCRWHQSATCTPWPHSGNVILSNPDSADWPTDEAKQLNGLHHAFLTKGTSLETYVERVIAYLGGAESDVFNFIATISSKLETGTFCPLDAGDRFAKKLSRAWASYHKAQGQSTTVKKRKRVPPSVARPVPIKAKPLKERLEESYAGFKAGNVTEDAFMTESRKFALIRVRRKFRGVDQFGQTEEDITQEAMRGMWRSLDKVNEEKGGYFIWFQRTIDNAVRDAKSGSMKEGMRHAPFMLPGKEGKEFDNPAMYGSIKFKRGGNGKGSVVCYQNPLPPFQRELPAFIQGVDLKICQYIGEGYNYARIGEVLSMTEKAIKERVAKMRQKNRELGLFK
jgi:DNA-directed RNA polymerase specialized sigma24 family protein